jgi:sec-independent protein translocase protein TatA
MAVPCWLVIVLLLFGPGRIGKVASELGKGLHDFRIGISGEEEEKTKTRKNSCL